MTTLAKPEVLDAELAVLEDRSQDPVLTYLAGLSTAKSRKTAIESLARVAALMRKHWRAVPWAQLSAKETAGIRMGLIDRHSPTTVRLTLSVLRGVLRAAFRLGLMSADEVERATSWPKLRAQKVERGRMLEDDEVAALRRHSRRFESPYRELLLAVWAVLLGAGARREEAVTATVDAYHRKKLRFTGKGRRERLMPLPPWACRDLEAWLEKRGELHLSTDRLLVRIDSSGRVFDSGLSPWGLWSLVVGITEDAGIEDISTHDLRRTYASKMLDKSDLPTTQRLMGHANPTTTVLYDRRGDRAAEKAVEALESWGDDT
jgi:integrase